jgi:disulfide oxidoreductase YuzD
VLTTFSLQYIDYDDDDDDDDDDELERSIMKVDHRTEIIVMEMTKVMRSAVNQTTMKTLAFQQSVTRV